MRAQLHNQDRERKGRRINFFFLTQRNCGHFTLQKKRKKKVDKEENQQGSILLFFLLDHMFALTTSGYAVYKHC